jgi:hypothetical protein
MNNTYYGSIAGATDYFANRLHATAWDDAVVADRPKALLAATQIINALSFKGYKASVYALLLASPSATAADVKAAEAAQELEFPRDDDTEVPEEIERATYEIAYSLLDGRDPEMELEALAVSSSRYASVATSYARDQVPVEHILNGVPSAPAWRLLLPFLRDSDEVNLSRVS